MKDIPGNLPLSAYHAMAVDRVRQIGASNKTCLVGGDRCPTAINSHSVPVAALTRIADDGHVYTFPSPTHEEMEAIYNGGSHRPRPCGINRALTYYGFCGRHDDLVFADVEKHDIEPTPRQASLLHFRAYSRALHLNMTAGDALRAISDARRPDNHEAQEALSVLASYSPRQLEAFADLERQCASMDPLGLSAAASTFDYIFMRFDCVPDVMCSTLFTPIYDIEGRFLLPLAKPGELESCQSISVTMSADSAGGFLLLAWNRNDTITDAFVRTFAESGYDLNRLIAVIFGNTENYCFRRQWWDALDDASRAFLMYCASVIFLNIADRHRDHLEYMHQLVRERRAVYVEWPVRSILRDVFPGGTHYTDGGTTHPTAAHVEGKDSNGPNKGHALDAQKDARK